MTTTDGKTLRQKMIQILTDNPQHVALVQLFELEASADEQSKTQIRQTILLVLQNHHDWVRISKCIKLWKGIQKYIRSFYKRMKERINESCDMNISTLDMESEFQRMFDKHRLTVKSKSEIISADIDKYLTKDYKKTQPGQPPVVAPSKIQSKKDEPIIKKDLPNKTIQPPTQKNQPSQKSNSVSSRDTNLNNVRVIEKKTTFGMLRRQDSSSNSTSNLVTKRNTSRRTFGQGHQLKSIKVNKIEHKNNEEKQDSKNSKTQLPNQEESKPKQIFKTFNQPQKPKQEIKNKPDEPRKLNIFERKQQTISRPNTLFTAQRKQPQQMKSKQKKLDTSMSKSVTPQKVLVHRKRIALKKPSDFESNFFDSDDQFSSFKKMQSYEKSLDLFSYTEEKDSYPLSNSQEQELKMEIQNELSSSYEAEQQLKNPEIEMKMAEKPKQNIFNKQNQQQRLNQSRLKNSSFSQSSIQISMVRKPDQLFSDYQVSLMGFNPRGLQSEVDYFKVVDKINTWSWKAESKKWDEKIQNLKNKRNKGHAR